MIGFPGARYDYRDYVDKYNQPYPLGPVSIMAATRLDREGIKPWRSCFPAKMW